MSRYRFTTAVLVTGLVGGLVGALIAIVVIQPPIEDEAPERGTIVRLDLGALVGAETRISCSDFHRFCVPRFKDPEDARALYLGDTHDHFRNAGSFVEWRPEFDVSRYDLPSGTPATGAFVGTGSGSLFLVDGTQVYGPSPRNLDEFPVEVVTETLPGGDGPIEVKYLMVDTSTLICGDWPSSLAAEELPDPECELAPPFD